MNRSQFIKLAALSGAGFALHGCSKKNKTHLLTLSFDDGFKKSFYRAAEIHTEYGLKACLNVIATGHFKTFHTEPGWIPQRLLGDFNDWNKLRSNGHEVMPHTWDHKDLTKMPLEEAKENLDKCFAYFKENLEGYDASGSVYNFAYNASTPELDAHALQTVRAVRTGGWLVLNDAKYNALPVPAEPVTLGCWSHGPGNCDAYVEEEINAFLKSAGGWLILNLHGLDDEGWGPVSTAYLDALLQRLVKVNYLDVVPTGAVLKKARR